MSIDDDLRAATSDLASPNPDEVVAAVLERRARRQTVRRRVRMAGAVAALALVVAGATLVAGGPKATEQALSGTAPGTSPSTAFTGATVPPTVDQDRVDAAWRSLPPGPLGERVEFASAWSGRELLVWGGLSWTPDAQEVARADGAAYDPRGDSWRPLPAAPGPGRIGAAATWTGDEMLIVGGRTTDAILEDGLAYDPDADAWRSLPAGPFEGRMPIAATWSGGQMVVALAEVDPGGANGAIVSYSPDTNRWSTLPAPGEFNRAAVVSSDSGIVLFTGLVDEMNGSVKAGVEAQRLDGEAWRPLGRVPGVLPQTFAASAIADILVAVDYDRRAALSDADDSWRKIESAPTSGSNCDPQLVPTSGIAVFWQCGLVAAVDGRGSWLPLTPSAGVMPRDAVAVSTGDLLLVWGRDFDAHSPVLQSFDLRSIQ